MRFACFALSLLLFAASARAENTDEANLLVERGIALFKNGDLAGARELFARAQSLVPDKPNPSRWLGLTDARLGNCADAVQELDRFISKVSLDDPRTIEAITIRDRCKEEIAPRVGTLVVESEPSGAEVRIDTAQGASAGTTPFRKESLRTGSHLVYLSKSGYRSSSSPVTIEQKETVRLQLQLDPIPPPSAAVTALAKSTNGDVLSRPVPARMTTRQRKRALVIGITIGSLALAGLAVGLGVGITQAEKGDLPAVHLQ